MSRKAIVCTIAFLCSVLASPVPGIRPFERGRGLGDVGSWTGYAKILAGHGEVERALELVNRDEAGKGLDVEGQLFKARLLTELGRYARADSVLALLDPETVPAGRYWYFLRRAKLNVLAGRGEVSLGLLSAVDSIPDESLEGYRDLIALQAYHALGRLDEAAELGERAKAAGTQPPPAAAEFESKLVDVYESQHKTEEASDLLQSLVRRTKHSRDRLDLLIRLYDIRIRSGDVKTARKTAFRIARSYGRFKRAESVAEDVLGRFAPADLDNDELITYARFYLDRSGFRKSSALLEALEGRKLGPGKREELRITWARYYYLTGRYERAVRLAKPRYEIPSIRRHSILLLARSYRKTGQKIQAARMYEYFARELPNDGKAAEALHVASMLYDAEGWSGAARRPLERLRTSYPSSYFGRLAVLRLAKNLMDRGEYGTSRKILNSALKRSRYTDEGAMYYLSRTYSKAGEQIRKQKILNDIAEFNPNSFYLFPRVRADFKRPHNSSTGKVALDGHDGLLAFLSAAAQNRERAYGTLCEKLDKSRDKQWRFPGKAARFVERGTWFLESGFRTWGEHELEHARRECSDSPRALLELGYIYDRYGMSWRSVRAYQKVKDLLNWQVKRDLSSEFLKLMYPTPYPVQVLENSAYYNLPPHLVYAMIREESRFDFNAVSRVGALGLMQLMPETGKYVARELEIPEWGDESLLTPEINLAFGIWYASSLMGSSGNDPLRMLAAYNAGPQNAKRWFGNKKGRDTEIDVVDSIDFKETRSYVKRVVESSNIYFSLYFDPGPPGSRASR